MDAKVIEFGGSEEGNLRGKLVDIVDALDREIDLTWVLIGLVETVSLRSRPIGACKPSGRWVVNRSADSEPRRRPIHPSYSARPNFSEEPLDTNTPLPRQGAQLRKFGGGCNRCLPRHRYWLRN